MIGLKSLLGVVTVAGAGCVALPPSGFAAEAPGRIATAVDAAFRPLLAQYHVPGIAVAVTVEGQRYFFNYGVGSKSENKPVTENTLFEIGSLSKTFTATLICYAQATGRISLDGHPGELMRALKGSAVDRANLLNLATFTAGGLPLQFPDAVETDAQMVTFFRQWTPDEAQGEERQYSNPSIGLAGHLVGLALHGDFSNVMDTDLLPKLGLPHSHIRVPPAEMNDYAWGYNAANKPVRVNPGVFDGEAYGVKSSSADMIRFVEANLRPDMFTAPLRQAIAGTHVGYFKTPTEMVQGLGWEQYPYPVSLEHLLAGNSTTMSMKPNAVTKLAPPRDPVDPTLFNKTGSTNGFGAYAVFVPAKRMGVVMLANRNFPIPARIEAAYKVLEVLASGAR